MRNLVVVLSGIFMTVVAATLGVNAVVNHAESYNTLLLMLGFASAQLPAYYKLANVEDKVNGNFSAVMDKLAVYEQQYTEALKLLPPEEAEKLPPLPIDLLKESERHED